MGLCLRCGISHCNNGGAEMRETMIYAAVMGYGTIGSGVVEILEKNRNEIRKAAGDEVEVKYVLDLNEFPGTSVEHKVIHDFSVLEKDEEISVVIEAMGGLNPAYPFVKACLLAGKHVATSNKALVAAHGTELLQIAREKQVNFFFEASVGGGIPIIRTLYRSLTGERIEEITGILNGTTNFILTKMYQEGLDFKTVLKEAQDLGYAERNPEADVEGHDTCRKIAILTAMVTGKEVNYENIQTKGITGVTDMDFRYAAVMDASVKLLGSSCINQETGAVQAWVAPVMIGRKHPLYHVNDVYNGILVKGNMLGVSMFYGSGAGKLPTASAVVSDIIEAVQNMNDHVPMGWSGEKAQMAGPEDTCHRFFVRIEGQYDRHEDLVKDCFGSVKVVELPETDEFALVTGRMSQQIYDKAEKQLKAASGETAIRQVIRVDESVMD